ILPVVTHTSAQSRLVRMHFVRSATISSLKHASAHAVHAWAHSKHAWIPARSLSRSTPPRSFGYASNISPATDNTHLQRHSDATRLRRYLTRYPRRAAAAGGSWPRGHTPRAGRQTSLHLDSCRDAASFNNSHQ